MPLTTKEDVLLRKAVQQRNALSFCTLGGAVGRAGLERSKDLYEEIRDALFGI